MKLNSWILSGLAVLALGGCGRESFVYLKDQAQRVDRKFPVREMQGSNAIDLLWVIDNSGSMGTYQQQVIQNANDFMQDFIKQKLNWKMGLISTDEDERPYAGFSGTVPLNASVVDPVGVFSNAVGKLGTNGSATEETFTPILDALNRDPSFLRKDTPLAIIMVTDAEEQSRIDAPDFIRDLAQITQGRSIFAYGVFAADDFGCNSDEGSWDYAGSPYETFIKSALVGQTYPLCRDFGTSLVNIAKDIVTRVTHSVIYLTNRPDPTTLKVLYQGEPLKGGPLEDGGFWIYDFGMNAIVFHNLDFAKNDTDDVQVVFDSLNP